MIRLKTSQLIRDKYGDVRPYTIAHNLNISLPTIYDLLKNAERGAINFEMLSKLCAALNVQPGALLEYVPDKGRKS